MDKKYYVYEWVRLDTNEPFYIGKGCGNRAYQTEKSRNKNFRKIIQETDTAVSIIIEGLTDKEAYEAEVWFIYEYRHILNYELVNADDGGLGAVSGKFNYMYGKKGELHPNFKMIVSEETRRKQSISRSGERNGMYGKKGELSPSFGKIRSSKEREHLSKLLKGRKFSDSHLQKLKEHCQTRNYKGTNNPNYGNGEKIVGGKNPAALKVRAVYRNGDILIFETKMKACESLGISLYLLTRLLGKTISVETDFSRGKEKYCHLDGCILELLNEGVTTS